MKRFLQIISICISFCLIQNRAQAQRVAGYMGKRFLVGIPVSYMPNIYGFFSSDNNVNYKGNSPLYIFYPPKIGASIGFVSSNLRTLVLDVDFQNIGVRQIGPGYTSNNAATTDFRYGRSKLVAFKLRIQKAFQHCAPVGGYKGLTLGLTSFNNSYINDSGAEVALDGNIDFSVGYAGGIRRVYKDKIVLDLGVEYNMFFKAIGNMFDFESIDKTLQENVGTHAINKNGLNSILVCKAAVYVLL